MGAFASVLPRVTVATGVGPKSRLVAYRSGVWAVTEAISETEGEFRWTVTHIPSGLKALRGDPVTRSRAIEVARRLGNALPQWRSKARYNDCRRIPARSSERILNIIAGALKAERGY